MTVNRHGCSGQSAGTQRVVIQTLQSIRQTLDISLKHLEICHENETDGNRLCMLQMGKAYGNLICIFISLLKNDAFQITQTVQDLINLFSQIQTGVHLTLVVPASGGVQFLTHIADPLDQTALDTHMNILILHIKYDLSISNILADCFQTRDDLVFLLIGNDALLAQHCHMSDTAVNILVVHSLIKKNRCIVSLYNIIHIFFKSSAPQTCHL